MKWKEKEMKKSLWLIHVNKKIYHNEYGSDFDYPNIKHHIKSTAWHGHHSILQATTTREVNNCISHRSQSCGSKGINIIIQIIGQFYYFDRRTREREVAVRRFGFLETTDTRTHIRHTV